MAQTNLERQVETRLREHEIRLTEGRRTLIQALGKADGPKSAADLHSRLGDQVPLSSIYRSLSVFEDAGVVSPHYSTKGVTRYELAEWLTGHHHHLVCVNCGVVEDIEIDDRLETQLEAIVEEIGRDVSFAPVDHALEIDGNCRQCQ